MKPELVHRASQAPGEASTMKTSRLVGADAGSRWTESSKISCRIHSKAHYHLATWGSPFTL